MGLPAFLIHGLAKVESVVAADELLEVEEVGEVGLSTEVQPRVELIDELIIEYLFSVGNMGGHLVHLFMGSHLDK
jgi:hypothetical protein